MKTETFAPFYAANPGGFKIRTPDGWKEFDGIKCTSHDKTYRLDFTGNYFLECNLDHKLFINETTRVKVSDLKVGDCILCDTGMVYIESIEPTGKTEPVYDVIEVEDQHRYYTNGVVSSNCEFVTYQETLIDAVKLREIKEKQVRKPVATTGKVRWFKKLRPGMTYLFALDPASGTGGNNAAIEIYEVPTLKQVAEWCDNTTDIPGQLTLMNRLLRLVHHELRKLGDPNPDLYWTFENNTIGEAAAVTVQQMGQDNFPGMLLNEPRKTRTGKVRKGLTTSASSKKTACFTMKKLIERGQMEVASEVLHKELNDFIARDHESVKFAAKEGCKDDVVSATLVITRMVQVISRYEMELAENVQDSLDDDFRKPLPIITYINR